MDLDDIAQKRPQDEQVQSMLSGVLQHEQRVAELGGRMQPDLKQVF